MSDANDDRVGRIDREPSIDFRLLVFIFRLRQRGSGARRSEGNRKGQRQGSAGNTDSSEERAAAY